jgi:hypothetical protein
LVFDGIRQTLADVADDEDVRTLSPQSLKEIFRAMPRLVRHLVILHLVSAGIA